jgi:hypothetical protein
LYLLLLWLAAIARLEERQPYSVDERKYLRKTQTEIDEGNAKRPDLRGYDLECRWCFSETEERTTQLEAPERRQH